MITSIRLQNFKAHRDTTVPLGRLTVLVGPNGTGKTSVLEALLGLHEIEGSDVDPINYPGVNRPLTALHNSSHLGPITVAVTGDDHGAPWQISVALTPKSAVPTKYDGAVSTAYGEAPLAPHTGSNVRETSLAKTALGEVVFHRFDAEQIAQPSAPEVGTPWVSDNGGNTAAVLASLKLADDERFPRIEAELRKIVPNVERIRLRRVNNGKQVFDSIHLDFRGAPDLPAYLASEGTLVTLALLTSICTASGPRTILLDDLGISLHPVAQMELVRQIKRLLDELPDVQIVATTHSSFILDEIDANDVQVFALRPDGSVATRPLSQHPEATRMKGALSAGQIWTLDPEERWVVAEGGLMLRIAVFCEAAGDFSTATELAERVVREEGPDWIRDHLEFRPWDDLRAWIGAGHDRHFDIHHIYEEARTRRIVLPPNRFGGERGGPGALMAYTAFLVARDEARRSGPIGAVILVWDMDEQGDARREGLDQGRKAVLLPMILGYPDLEREAWVLAGFEPRSAVERGLLDQERKTLGFDPCREASRLRDKQDSAPRSPKRVLNKLTGGDRDREVACWAETPLATLRANGEQNGLRAYLDEVRDRLLPLFSRA